MGQDAGLIPIGVSNENRWRLHESPYGEGGTEWWGPYDTYPSTSGPAGVYSCCPEAPATVTITGGGIPVTFTLSYTAQPDGAGQVAITSPIPSRNTYYQDEAVTLTAEPVDGFKFEKWTGDVTNQESSENPLTTTMDSDKSISANFVPGHSVSVCPQYTVLKPNGKLQFHAKAKDPSGTETDVSGKSKWKADGNGKISPSGLFRAGKDVNKGSHSTVTATYNGVSSGESQITIHGTERANAENIEKLSCGTSTISCWSRRLVSINPGNRGFIALKAVDSDTASVYNILSEAMLAGESYAVSMNQQSYLRNGIAVDKNAPPSVALSVSVSADGEFSTKVCSCIRANMNLIFSISEEQVGTGSLGKECSDNSGGTSLLNAEQKITFYKEDKLVCPDSISFQISGLKFSETGPIRKAFSNYGNQYRTTYSSNVAFFDMTFKKKYRSPERIDSIIKNIFASTGYSYKRLNSENCSLYMISVNK